MRHPNTPEGWRQRTVLSGRKVADMLATFKDDEEFIDCVDGEWLAEYQRWLVEHAPGGTLLPEIEAMSNEAQRKEDGIIMGFCIPKAEREKILAHLRALADAAPGLAQRWRLAS